MSDASPPRDDPDRMPPPAALGQPLLRKIALFLTLSATEQEVLRRILRRRRTVPAHTELLSDAAPADHFFAFESGWAIREKHLSDGRRQVLNLVLPGDCPGLRGSLFGMNDERLVVISEAVIYAIENADILELFRVQPKIAAAITWAAAREEAILSDHIVSLGRRSAFERLAHLFLELYRRLQVVGLAADHRFPFPVTQEITGDLLGLSVVHVNRTLRRLREEALVEVEGGWVELKDVERLAAISDFESPHLDPRQAPKHLHRTLAELGSAAPEPDQTAPGAGSPANGSAIDEATP